MVETDGSFLIPRDLKPNLKNIETKQNIYPIF